MATTVDALTGRTLHGSGVAQPPTAARDPRLDFFRGIAMFIIFCAHTPGNFFTRWIPARWGFSDATEIFVFCSGMASAIAFGAVFDRAGWRLGSARVGFRVWQVYWAHIGLFIACATFLAALDQTGAFEKVYIGTLNLWKFFAEPAQQIVGLVTLTYVPNYFDILPMYLVILAMIPLVMALARVSLWAVAAFVVLVWIAAQGRILDPLLGLSGISFPAEPWSDRQWFFNPLGWQLVFFTGFALMRGWLPSPPVRWWLVVIALLLLVAMFPFSSVGRRAGFDVNDWAIADRMWTGKTDFGILRYLHFLALAYVAWVAVGPGGAVLRATGRGTVARVWAGFVAIVMKVGQQSLAVFLFSMFWARVTGFGMDVFGRGPIKTTVANLLGFALIVALAYGVAWIKSQPWRVKTPRGSVA